jgi:hypothetical protein
MKVIIVMHWRRRLLALYITQACTRVDGTFDEAIIGVDLVEHTASHLHFKAVEPGGPYLHFCSFFIRC